MDHTLQAAARVGVRHPAPLLDMEELLVQVEGTLGPLPPETRTLHARLRSRTDLFRVLDPWRGPLRSLCSAVRPGRASPEALGTHGLPRRAWVLPRLPAREAEPENRIREGVAAFARMADDGSLRSLLRLARLVREEKALRAERIARRSRPTGP